MPQTVSNTPNAAQDTISFCSKGKLLTHVQLGIPLEPQVLFCQAVSQLCGPQYILLHGVVPPQVKDFVLLHFELSQPPSNASDFGSSLTAPTLLYFFLAQMDKIRT